VFGPIYADCLGIAIVSRLLAFQPSATGIGRRPVAELVKWRLRRVLDYMDAHLEEQISLADWRPRPGFRECISLLNSVRQRGSGRTNTCCGAGLNGRRYY
jgi:hypothetical protein